MSLLRALNGRRPNGGCEFLRVQAIYSDAEIEQLRDEVYAADADQMLAILKRIQAKHEALVWMHGARSTAGNKIWCSVMPRCSGRLPRTVPRGPRLPAVCRCSAKAAFPPGRNPPAVIGLPRR